jgi:phytoene synthase
VVHRYDIPQAIPEALLQGFAWDAEGRRYATLDAVKAYGARVAGTVGVMMALVMGARSREALARAADLGIAMQLTNIARDIGEDARAGRCYLPQAWLAGAGLTEEDIAAAAEAPEAVRAMTRALLEEADGLYRSGLAGLGYLPPACRPAIRAAALIYARIGRVIARSGYDSVSGRAVVSGRRKAALAARAMLPGGALGDFASGPADPSCRFLIEAVPPAAGETSPAGAAGWAWAIDLFIELERRNSGRLPAFAGKRSGARHA